ncbi:MAG: DNA repair protein RecN [Gammaproteobacteria bacterium]|nr:DNA repair protein RecN [Gammaproteobacteria bacterium]
MTLGHRIVLTHIHLQNFAIVEKLELELHAGMTALTGETGAGKSIILDALQLALGGRGATSVIRHGTERTDITAIFDLTRLSSAQLWLQNNDFTYENNECYLRRVLSIDGRSRHFINGQACAQQQLRDLGELLLTIHGQHEHQNLLKRDQQRATLDRYAQHPDLLSTVKNLANQWKNIQQQLEQLQHAGGAPAKLALLQYQVSELQNLALTPNELVELEKEQKQLAHADQLLSTLAHALNLLDDDEQTSITKNLNTALRDVQHLINIAPSIQSSAALLESAIIQVQEASNELNHYRDQVEINPERLHYVEQRLEQIHAAARKHHIKPEALLEMQTQLEAELDRWQHAGEHQEKLLLQLTQLENDYQHAAQNLRTSREKSAKKLSQLVSENMQHLGMQGGQFEIQLTANDMLIPSPHGSERIEFYVSANPGLPLQLLNKVASGGELSRISLALQMITAEQEDTPTLIFDEVDVGIGGTTAAIVGQLLHQLSTKVQVLCITHLPQVAAQATHHLHVKKWVENKQTIASIVPLLQKARVDEIARMLGGIKITEQTVKHAEEMLTN